jgi:hypothetical protein
VRVQLSQAAGEVEGDRPVFTTAVRKSGETPRRRRDQRSASNLLSVGKRLYKTEGALGRAAAKPEDENLAAFLDAAEELSAKPD